MRGLSGASHKALSLVGPVAEIYAKAQGDVGAGRSLRFGKGQSGMGRVPRARCRSAGAHFPVLRHQELPFEEPFGLEGLRDSCECSVVRHTLLVQRPISALLVAVLLVVVQQCHYEGGAPVGEQVELGSGWRRIVWPARPVACCRCLHFVFLGC